MNSRLPLLTIFPLTETAAFPSGIQGAIGFLIDQQRIKYTNVTDFLLAEFTTTSFKKQCLDYYDDQAKQLRFSEITADEIEYLDRYMATIVIPTIFNSIQKGITSLPEIQDIVTRQYPLQLQPHSSQSE